MHMATLDLLPFGWDTIFSTCLHVQRSHNAFQSSGNSIDNLVNVFLPHWTQQKPGNNLLTNMCNPLHKCFGSIKSKQKDKNVQTVQNDRSIVWLFPLVLSRAYAMNSIIWIKVITCNIVLHHRTVTIMHVFYSYWFSDTFQQSCMLDCKQMYTLDYTGWRSGAATS